MSSKPLYGLTHDRETGAPMVRIPRVLKVSIGVPKGPDKHVWIDLEGKWVVETRSQGEGKKRGEATLKTFEKMREARDYYNRAKVPDRPYPIRLAYFTFTKVGHDGSQSPDWSAIEKHGSLPTSIDIVLVEDEPFLAEFQYWNSAELLCHGDGRNAERLVSFGAGLQKQFHAAAELGKKEDKRRFTIKDGCATRECPYYQQNNDVDKPLKGADCKPHGELRFQLIGNPMLGGTGYYVTTGKRSIRNLFSSLETFRAVTGGRVAGIPMKMVVGPYKTQTPGGRPQTQYAVHLEFRADSAPDLRRKMIAAASEFQSAGIVDRSTPLLSLPAGPRSVDPQGEPDPGNDEAVDARHFVDEFVAGNPSEDERENFEAHGARDVEEEPEGRGDDSVVESADKILNPVLVGEYIAWAKKHRNRSRKDVDEMVTDLLNSGSSKKDVETQMLRDIASTKGSVSEPTQEPRDQDEEFN